MTEVTPARTGTIPFQVPSLDKECFTFYKIFGNISPLTPPVVVLHGGPGVGHEYLLSFAELWERYGLPVVFYDQIGCASSTHLREKRGDEQFWQESLFIAELDNLLEHLKLRDGPGFHILGHSWGGGLGSVFAATKPRGLQKLVLASATSCRGLSIQGTQLQYRHLAPDVQKALTEADEKKIYDSDKYKAAQKVFFRQSLCRVEPPPAALFKTFENLKDDDTVNYTMNGPFITAGLGSMRNWSAIDRLPQINATTLVYNSEYDTSHDIAQYPFVQHIPKVQWIRFDGLSHMCHLEDKAKVLTIIGDFLTQEGFSGVPQGLVRTEAGDSEDSQEICSWVDAIKQALKWQTWAPVHCVLRCDKPCNRIGTL